MAFSMFMEYSGKFVINFYNVNEEQIFNNYCFNNYVSESYKFTYI